MPGRGAGKKRAKPTTRSSVGEPTRAKTRRATAGISSTTATIHAEATPGPSQTSSDSGHVASTSGNTSSGELSSTSSSVCFTRQFTPNVRIDMPAGAKNIQTRPISSDNNNIDRTSTNITRSPPRSSSSTVTTHVDNSTQELAPLSTDSLGFHLPQATRDKIFKGEFVEFSGLLKGWDRNGQHDGTLKINKDGLLEMQRSTNDIKQIGEWMTAFTIFSSVYLEQFPQKHQELLKYMYVIQLAAKRGQNWIHYDRQFRLRMAKSPMSWGEIHAELWLLYMNHGTTGEDRHSTQYNPHPMARQPPSHTQKLGFCWDYNEMGKICRRQNCKFQHTCFNCGGEHPQAKCRSTKQFTPNNRRPFLGSRGPRPQPNQARSPTGAN